MPSPPLSTPPKEAEAGTPKSEDSGSRQGKDSAAKRGPSRAAGFAFSRREKSVPAFDAIEKRVRTRCLYGFFRGSLYGLCASEGLAERTFRFGSLTQPSLKP